MRKLVEFFISNPKFNHTLFVMCFVLGIWSYSNMPKEMFPVTESDMIAISGGYAGSSIDTLDKIAVKELESDILGLEEVKEITSSITPGRFEIMAELKDGVDKKRVLDDIEASIKRLRQNMPSDMNDPTPIIIKLQRPLLYVGLGSRDATKKELIDRAELVKNRLASIKGVSGIDIFGDNDSILEFVLKEKVIQAFGLDISQVMSSISSLSYTFPIGDIKDTSRGYYYLTMNAGNKAISDFENTILKIGPKEIFLKDIAEVKETFREESSKAYINGKSSIILTINQLTTANGIEVVKDLREAIEKMNSADESFELVPYNDKSIPIKKRLNIVFSNIMFGMILVTLALYMLINRKLSIVIGLGIPTSFILAFIFADQFGMSINIVSLLGLLIALGIVVDDAIVVGENIQRHIEVGDDKRESAIKGVMEVAGPITMASVTTLFAFLPMLMISGQMGKFIMLIPIMVSVLLVASLLEVFVFLPIHAEHMLDRNDRVVSWEKINSVYGRILAGAIHFKKTFLGLFFVLVPVLTVVILKHSSFQMFPKFDASEFKISGKFDKNYSLAQTSAALAGINEYMSENKEALSIASYTLKVGSRRVVSGRSESGENMFTIDVELKERIPQNVFEEYIDPVFALVETEEGSRTESSKRIAERMLSDMKRIEGSEKIEEFTIIERRVGPVKTDIHLSVSAQTQSEIVETVNALKKELSKVKGVKDMSDDLALGVPELKLKINRYGESLGLSEVGLGRILSNVYLENKRFNIFTTKELVEVNFVSEYEDDLAEFKEKEITLPGGKRVVLSEVVDFEEVNSFMKVVKIDGIITKNLYANVDTQITTATDVLDGMSELIEGLQRNQVVISAKGENQSKKEFADDMKKAVFLAMTLIMLAMLYMFKRFLYVFIIVSVIPFSVIGALLGHLILGVNLSMPSMIGILGLAGVVINDAILMLSFVDKATGIDDFLEQSKLRFRPIMLTSITTLLGLITLIFFATGQAKILQPIAISLGFGLAWGTVINLLYVPVLYALINGYRK